MKRTVGTFRAKKMNIDELPKWYTEIKTDYDAKLAAGEINQEQHDWKMNWLNSDLEEEKLYKEIGLIK